jgi:diacylglycerol kinase
MYNPVGSFHGRKTMSVMMSEAPGAEAVTKPPRPRLSWWGKFRVAFRGIKFGVRGHSSFAVHLFFTVAVLVAAVVLECERWEWCALLGCIGFVLTTELMNSAVETLFRGLDDATKERTWPALDIAAGAVLLASLFAAVIGCVILFNR